MGTAGGQAINGNRSGSFERTVVALVCLAILGSCAGVAIATVVARLLALETLGPATAGTLVGMVACCALARRVANRLPRELDGWFGRRRALSIVWCVAAVLSVVNTARLGLFAADASQRWASAFPPVEGLAQHQCLAAYVRAGELAAHGQANLWNPVDYDEPKPDDAARTAVPPQMHGLSRYLRDSFEYPPPFAVLSRAAVAATDDYQIVRAAWFGISAVGFLLALMALAIWIAGRAGATALLLAPVVMLSMPVALNLQFGQAHLLIVAASIIAMMQFARGRLVTGGLLLGLATATKIFPGLLLVHLAVRRQWRAVAATLAAIAALLGLAAVVLGPSTLSAFVSEQIPRLASGEAFAFAEDNTDNYSLYGLAFKLSMIGVDAGRGLASILAWAWTVVAVVLAVLASRGRAEPVRDVIVWLGIFCVATLRSPFAPTYTMVSTLWLLSVAAGVVTPRRWLTVLIAIAWILVEGAPPVGSEAGNAVASLPGQAASIAVALVAVWPRRRPTS